MRQKDEILFDIDDNKHQRKNILKKLKQKTKKIQKESQNKFIEQKAELLYKQIQQLQLDVNNQQLNILSTVSQTILEQSKEASNYTQIIEIQNNINDQQSKQKKILKQLYFKILQNNVFYICYNVFASMVALVNLLFVIQNGLLDTRLKSINFILTDKIGEGSYGTVFHVINQDDQQEYAIKVLDKNKLKNKIINTETKMITMLDQVHNEIEFMNNHKYPLFLYINDMISNTNKNQHLYILEQLAEGVVAQVYQNIYPTILDQQLIKKYFPKMEYLCNLNVIMQQYDEILIQMTQISLAVMHLHELNLIHGDLKHANILKIKGPIYILADFGLSQDIQQGKQYKNPVSPAYQSSDNQGLTKENDIWCLGVIFFMNLVGYHPASICTLFAYQNKIFKYDNYQQLLITYNHQIYLFTIDYLLNTQKSMQQIKEQAYQINENQNKMVDNLKELLQLIFCCFKGQQERITIKYLFQKVFNQYLNYYSQFYVSQQLNQKQILDQLQRFKISFDHNDQKQVNFLINFCNFTQNKYNYQQFFIQKQQDYDIFKPRLLKKNTLIINEKLYLSRQSSQHTQQIPEGVTIQKDNNLIEKQKQLWNDQSNQYISQFSQILEQQGSNKIAVEQSDINHLLQSKLVNTSCLSINSTQSTQQSFDSTTYTTLIDNLSEIHQLSNEYSHINQKIINKNISQQLNTVSEFTEETNNTSSNNLKQQIIDSFNTSIEQQSTSDDQIENEQSDFGQQIRSSAILEGNQQNIDQILEQENTQSKKFPGIKIQKSQAYLLSQKLNSHEELSQGSQSFVFIQPSKINQQEIQYNQTSDFQSNYQNSGFLSNDNSLTNDKIVYNSQQFVSMFEQQKGSKEKIFSNLQQNYKIQQQNKFCLKTYIQELEQPQNQQLSNLFTNVSYQQDEQQSNKNQSDMILHNTSGLINISQNKSKQNSQISDEEIFDITNDNDYDQKINKILKIEKLEPNSFYKNGLISQGYNNFTKIDELSDSSNQSYEDQEETSQIPYRKSSFIYQQQKYLDQTLVPTETPQLSLKSSKYDLIHKNNDESTQSFPLSGSQQNISINGFINNSQEKYLYVNSTTDINKLTLKNTQINTEEQILYFSYCFTLFNKISYMIRNNYSYLNCPQLNFNSQQLHDKYRILQENQENIIQFKFYELLNQFNQFIDTLQQQLKIYNILSSKEKICMSFNCLKIYVQQPIFLSISTGWIVLNKQTLLQFMTQLCNDWNCDNDNFGINLFINDFQYIHAETEEFHNLIIYLGLLHAEECPIVGSRTLSNKRTIIMQTSERFMKMQLKRQKLEENEEKIQKLNFQEEKITDFTDKFYQFSQIQYQIPNGEQIAVTTTPTYDIYYMYVNEICVMPVHLLLCLCDLINNSRNYSPSKSTIRISMFNYENYLYLIIRDNGLGLQEQDTQKPFYNINMGQMRQQKENLQCFGCGMGLKHLQMIVNEYNGTINISSIYNGGTKIVIKIKFGDELL